MQNTSDDIPDDRPEQPFANADIDWQEGDLPYSSRFDDIYFSRQGGLAETEHVFLAANRVRERWAELERELARGQEPAATDEASQRVFTITELGFGTGLNFLCTWRAWHDAQPDASPTRHLRLHYIACEKYPMRREALKQALRSWDELVPYSAQLIAAYPDHSPGYHRLNLSTADGCEVTLDLYYGDAREMLAQQAAHRRVRVDAWFLDGFAPRVNPQMWTPALFAVIAGLSGPGSTLSTYSVAGQVVRNVQESGFSTSKQPGFGQKRHMLHGTYVGSLVGSSVDTFTGYSQPETAARDAATAATNDPPPTSWLQLPRRASVAGSTAPHVIIIGAGVAGCSAAYSLARRGCRVTVVERATDVAAGASGNRQAVLQCRLSNACNASWQFNLQAYLYAARHYQQLSTSADLQWHPTGVLNLDTAFSSRRQRCAEVRLDLYSEQVVRRVEADEASRLAGIALREGGNFQPLGGWLNPPALCRAWLDHPLISVVVDRTVTQLTRQDQGWAVQATDSRQPEAGVAVTLQADAVIIANSHAARQLAQTAALPLVPLRGQVTYVEESAASSPLACVVCGLSYISPAHDGLHSTGASYSKDVSDLAISPQEHEQNLAGIEGHLPPTALDGSVGGGRVSVRAGTGDRMPIVGPVPDFADFENTWLSLLHRERRSPAAPAALLPGLYVSVGHGSHGVSNAPLAGEYLADLITNGMLPLQDSVAQCLHPGRFLLRDLRKRQSRRRE